ncbi:MAG: 6-phosphofructokinase [Clostridia bacterium]|nr:6-phosphofructokinase [Clostridia bacterium]
MILNAIVGQSGGPTAAINATLAGVIKGFRQHKEIGTLYGAYNGIEGVLAERFCNLGEKVDTDEKLEILKTTPAAALGSCRLKLPDIKKLDSDPECKKTYEKLFEIFKKHNIGYFFYIGGNDSMDTVYKISEYSKISDWKMKVIGIPKTIDNDLVATDHTPGFGSAAKYIATSMQEIIRDCSVYTVKAVTIVEIMGRDAGWLTASAGLPKIVSGVSPDLIYLPEKPFNVDEFLEDVKQKLSEKSAVVVAVSEGIRDKDGKYAGESAQSGSVDAFGHKYLSGTGKALEMIVKEKIGCKVRSVELNILQRCAAHLGSLTDIEEGVEIASFAVDNAVAGKTGMMASYKRLPGKEYKCEFELIDISTIANAVRSVPLEFINERGNFVTDECLEYILPLIKGETQPKYENGLPVHIIL